ncbi:MAG: hypothetical protein N3A58_06035 [Spirochaetes bacterium]|nr:hypothetical protein [Spirochaetota bacterium]
MSILQKVYKNFDINKFSIELKNEYVKDKINLIFFNDIYFDTFFEFDQKYSNKNFILINNKYLINDGNISNNSVFHFILPENVKYVIYPTENYHFFLNNLNIEEPKIKYLLVITNCLSPESLYDFSFNFYNILSSKIKYNIIHFEKKHTSLLYNQNKIENFFLILFFEKDLNFEIYNEFWEKKDTYFTITDVNKNLINSINMISPFEYFFKITNLKTTEELKDFLKLNIFKFNIYKKSNIFTKFFIENINFEEKLFSNIAPSKFQSFFLYKLSKTNLINTLVKLTKEKLSNSMLLIDQSLIQNINIRNKFLNFIPIKTFFFIDKIGPSLPSNGLIIKGYY